MSNTIRASVVQTCTASFDLSDTLEKFENLTKLAKQRDDTQLVVFPEAFIGGYPKMSTFGCVVGERSAEGREEFLRYYKSAIEIPSAATSRVEAVSKETGVFVVMGVVEREGGTLYCTVIFVDPVKGLVGKHRKLMPTGSERLIWGQGDGSTLPVVEGTFKEVKTKISAAICWENYMPLLRTYYYSMGTQIYCAPTVDQRSVWGNSMVHIAVEGRCFVLSACQFATQRDYPEGHAAHNGDLDKSVISGGSLIVSPLGTVLAGPSRKAEDILTAELDLDDVIRGKFDLDTVGHYARPDGGCRGLCIDKADYSQYALIAQTIYKAGKNKRQDMAIQQTADARTALVAAYNARRARQEKEALETKNSTLRELARIDAEEEKRRSRCAVVVEEKEEEEGKVVVDEGAVDEMFALYIHI